jgi:hypothetical protein
MMQLRGDVTIVSDDHPMSLFADLMEASEGDSEVQLVINGNTYYVHIEDA